jgi:glycosyltransferase involved in cell wall biosynthesis
MISIITPTLNGEKFIEKTYFSIKKNIYFSEWIVVDGGSIDNTIPILNSFNDNFIKIHQLSGNSSIAINHGIKSSINNIVGIIGCDDMYENYTSELVINSFKNNPSFNWCIGQNKIIDEFDNEINFAIKFYKNFKLKRYDFKNLITENFIPSMSVFWKKKIHIGIGYWDTKIINCNDYDMWLRIAEKYKPLIINKNLSFFRIHKNNSSQKNFGKNLCDAYIISKKYFKNNYYLKIISKIKIIFFIFASKILK